jgi:transposase
VAYRELFVVEVREILRRWVGGDSLRAIAAVVTADRKTVRGYVSGARGLGVVQGGEPPDDALIAQVIAAVHPGRPSQDVGSARALCRAHREIIAGWVEEGCNGPRVAELLERHTGQRVPRRTLGRFLAEELGTSVARSTVRVVDPEPGKVLEIDFMEARVWLGGRLQKVYALVAVAARSRHLFVWPCQSMTRQDVIDALEAAWAYFGGVFPVVIVDNMKAVVARPDVGAGAGRLRARMRGHLRGAGALGTRVGQARSKLSSAPCRYLAALDFAMRSSSAVTAALSMRPAATSIVRA